VSKAERSAGWLKSHGLGLVVTALFLVTMIGQIMAGFVVFNDEQAQHGVAELTLGAYLVTGHFIEATAENWESEFLQMACYVLLTIVLFQRGSSESKEIGKRAAVDRDPRLARAKPDAPWPVRRGGWVLRIYENSLSLAFVFLFLFSFVLHAIGGANAHNEALAEHGQPTQGVLAYLTSAQFWFESFQNWQSEFLSLAAMVVLSVYLRQRGSPESKPVDAPHHETGS
jgi:hypothetical protein